MENSQQNIGWRLPVVGRYHLGFILGALLLLCAVLSLSAPSSASALTTVPTKMNFQGRLTDSVGNVKPNGTYNMRLRLYTVNSGGSAVWTEDRLVSAGNGVTVTNGLFSIQLGSVTALPANLFASGPLYLEVELPTPASATTTSPVWTEGAMTPRNQMATSAYAYNAETLDGKDSTDFGQLVANNTWSGDNYFSGNSFEVNVGGAGHVYFTGDEISVNAGNNGFTVNGDSIFNGGILLSLSDTAINRDSTSAFRVQDSLGANAVFVADTVNKKISVANVSPLTSAVVGANVISSIPNITSGSYPSSVLASDGFLRISYYDSAAQDLNFMQCTNADCSTRNISTVDSAGVVGFDSSIAMGPDGFARISYYDSTNGDLKYAQCTNAACSTSVVTAIDTTSNVGSHTSIAVASDGFARISYAANAVGDLKFIQCTNASCSTRNTSTVDNSAGTQGVNTSLVLGSDGFARIAYGDLSAVKIKFAQCTNAACSTSNITVINDGNSSNPHISITMGADGYPRITYVKYINPGPYELHFVQCTNAACTTNNDTMLKQSVYDADVSIAPDGYARIAYQYSPPSTSGDLKYIQCTNTACTTYNDTAIDTYEYKGGSPSLHIASDGFARITYTGSQGGAGGLYVARLTNDSGNEIRGGVTLGSSGADAFTGVYTKKLDVEGGVTIDATTHNHFGPALTITGSDSFIEATKAAANGAKFIVTKDNFTYTNDSVDGGGFGYGNGGFNVSMNNAATALSIYQGGTGAGALITVMPTASSALRLYNDDMGYDMLNVAPDGKTTFFSEAADTKAFSFSTYSGTLFAIDNSNTRVQIGEATADANGVVLVLDTKNTAGDPTGVDGAMYYNSSMRSFRCYQSGSWRSCMGGLVYSNTAASNTISNTTTETDFSTAYTIPAGSCQPGKVYRITARGIFNSWNNLAPGNITLRVKLGSTVLAASPAQALGQNRVNRLWTVNFDVTCVTYGASGSLEGQGFAQIFTAANANTPLELANTAVVSGVDLTASQQLKLSAQFTVANLANNITLRQLTVEELGP